MQNLEFHIKCQSSLGSLSPRHCLGTLEAFLSGMLGTNMCSACLRLAPSFFRANTGLGHAGWLRSFFGYALPRGGKARQLIVFEPFMKPSLSLWGRPPRLPTLLTDSMIIRFQRDLRDRSPAALMFSWIFYCY